MVVVGWKGITGMVSWDGCRGGITQVVSRGSLVKNVVRRTGGKTDWVVRRVDVASRCCGHPYETRGRRRECAS